MELADPDNLNKYDLCFLLDRILISLHISTE